MSVWFSVQVDIYPSSIDDEVQIAINSFDQCSSFSTFDVHMDYNVNLFIKSAHWLPPCFIYVHMKNEFPLCVILENASNFFWDFLPLFIDILSIFFFNVKWHIDTCLLHNVSYIFVFVFLLINFMRTEFGVLRVKW